MAHKYFADQFDDEEVLLVFRKHPIVMRKGLVFASLALLVGPVITLVMSYVKPEGTTMTFYLLSLAASFVLCIIVFFPYWLGWYFSVYVMTNQRFIQSKQKGFFHKSVVDISLPQITSLNYEIAGFQETLLGFGTILVQTYMGDLVIHDVHHPGRVVKKIAGHLRELGVDTQTGMMPQREVDD